MKIKNFKLILSFFLFSNNVFAQLKLSDFKNFPLGIYFDNYREIKSYFQSKPILMKGEIKDTYQVNYENVPFDKFGSANYTFQFVNNILSNVEIKYSFMSFQLNDFENFIKNLRNDIWHDYTGFYNNPVQFLDTYSIVNYLKKECRGEMGPDNSNQFDSVPTGELGWEDWEIKNSRFNDKRFLRITVDLQKSDNQWYDWNENKQYEYHGNLIVTTISFTNFQLKTLRNWELTQGRHTYTGFTDSKKIIKLKDNHGIYTLPINIDNTLTIDFVLDLGASDVSISPDVFSILYKTGNIEESDFIGTQSYKLADGSSAKSRIINLKSLMIGDIKLENVRASISNSVNAPLLLGQSALKELGKYSIDNINKELVIE